MRSTRPLFFTLICKVRILPLGARLRSRTSTAVASLHTQTRRKDELTNSSTEATKEGIEGLLWGEVVSYWSRFPIAGLTPYRRDKRKEVMESNEDVAALLARASTYVVSS